MKLRSSVHRTIAALDVGGSSVKRGLVRSLDTVEVVRAAPLDALGERRDVLDQLGAAAAGVLDLDPTCRSLAIAFPSPFDPVRGAAMIEGQHKFDAIHGVPLVPELRERTHDDVVVTFCNDAEAAAIGESVAGAGRAFDRVLMITLGTGFGTALVVGGAAVGTVGAWEVGLTYTESVSDRGRADDVLSARGLAKLLDISPDHIERWVREGRDVDTFVRYGRELGWFLAGLARRADADVVVVGGGVAGAFDLFGGAAAEHLDVPLVPTALGRTGPLIGAAAHHRASFDMP